ncbi:hypothetical protein AJ80_08064 [Polytolypa hystricis UAMH7299]|uniref:Uncharacterized protein n=1 Tax=Polytolypa hystricis (strain UAMH7299) TaxID=1447883 RepID=A0A2B7XE58_POLH7|nr:hypothetical protein AJ80_08064 [Polytolypa hystricis UAMH7299]
MIWDRQSSASADQPTPASRFESLDNFRDPDSRRQHKQGLRVGRQRLEDKEKMPTGKISKELIREQNWVSIARENGTATVNIPREGLEAHGGASGNATAKREANTKRRALMKVSGAFKMSSKLFRASGTASVGVTPSSLQWSDEADGNRRMSAVIGTDDDI